jgi:rod shape-determining protein MreD
MPIKILSNFSRFFVLILVQVLILNNIELSGYINPYIYVLFIILLPVEVPSWFLIVSSFLIGLGVDMFSNSMGLHAAASVFIAFCRPFLLKRMAPREGYEPELNFGVKKMGLQWFITYASIMVLLHHFVLFYLEIFRFEEFFTTFLRMIISSVITIILIMLSQFVFYRTGN